MQTHKVAATAAPQKMLLFLGRLAVNRCTAREALPSSAGPKEKKRLRLSALI